jgi:hypothetical protein
MHKPPNNSNKLEYRCSKENTYYGGTLECLYINDNNFKPSDCNKNHGEIKKCEEALAFFCYRIF